MSAPSALISDQAQRKEIKQHNANMRGRLWEYSAETHAMRAGRRQVQKREKAGPEEKAGPGEKAGPEEKKAGPEEHMQ